MDKAPYVPDVNYDGLQARPNFLIGENYLPRQGATMGKPADSIDNCLNLDGCAPTYSPTELDRATDYFRKNYIPAIARLTGKSYISHLAKPGALDFDRSELSRIVNEYNLKPELEKVKEEPAVKKYGSDIPADILDPIVKRVVREGISLGYYGLNDATERFKDIYVNNLARYFGETEAASILGVTAKTVSNRIQSYLIDERNKLIFPDDRIVAPDLEQRTKVLESATQKQAKDELKQWQEQKMAGFSLN